MLLKPLGHGCLLCLEQNLVLTFKYIIIQILLMIFPIFQNNIQCPAYSDTKSEVRAIELEPIS